MGGWGGGKLPQAEPDILERRNVFTFSGGEDSTGERRAEKMVRYMRQRGTIHEAERGNWEMIWRKEGGEFVVMKERILLFIVLRCLLSTRIFLIAIFTTLS